jgi:hypothetical protein
MGMVTFDVMFIKNGTFRMRSRGLGAKPEFDRDGRLRKDRRRIV